MNDEQFRKCIHAIHQRMAMLYGDLMQSSASPQQQTVRALEEVAAALGNLQLLYKEMLTSVKASPVVEEGLF